MIRLLNDYNGFTDRNITNIGYLSSDKYPKQKIEALGKWTALRYLNEDDGNPEREVNNRLYLQSRDYPDHTIIKNSGFISFFKIIRYDLEEPYKVVLIGEEKDNSVIITTKDVFENTYDLVGSTGYLITKSKAEARGYEYYSPNTTTDIDLFVEKYNNEYIHSMKVQDKDTRFIPIYTEYYTDILEKPYEYLSMDKKEPVGYNDNTLIKVETEETRHIENPNYDDPTSEDYHKDFGYETVVIVSYIDTDTFKEYTNGYITQDYRNRFKFTEKTRDWLILNKSTLRGFPDEILKSFKQYYTVHKPTNINIPRRAHNLGIIIRSDINGSEAQSVAIEYINEDDIRVICQDEANFFFDTWTGPYTMNRDTIILDLLNEKNFVSGGE